ncbi:hypothetical protein [Streptomyces sp. NBC_01217]|uniref:hypothetical protein n=1 Tax=Streptomyces sp. NBC_01217 TaxID=2903779 RepID=UPI002E14BD87|nr:hypothetical protein OG507_04710 [Streptomyces sp. NBC_01217]
MVAEAGALTRTAEIIVAGVTQTIASDTSTRDLGGSASTTEFTASVVKAIEFGADRGTESPGPSSTTMRPSTGHEPADARQRIVAGGQGRVRPPWDRRSPRGPHRPEARTSKERVYAHITERDTPHWPKLPPWTRPTCPATPAAFSTTSPPAPTIIA